MKSRTERAKRELAWLSEMLISIEFAYASIDALRAQISAGRSRPVSTWPSRPSGPRLTLGTAELDRRFAHEAVVCG
jgi:hypothetical protein